MATETWVINEHPYFSAQQFLTLTIEFISNDIRFSEFGAFGNQGGDYIMYDSTQVYYGPSDFQTERWIDQAYRTITLDEPASGDLLTWLEANAVKQEVIHTIGTVDITALESALTASADAIREKSESTELIDFDMEGGTGFAEAIEAIPSGGPQGEYNIIPILKEDGTQRLQITDSGSFSLKVKTITQNGSYDPTEEDVNGYSSVIVAIPTYDGTVV